MSNLPEESGAPLFWLGCGFALLVGCAMIALSPQTSFWGIVIIGLCLIILKNRLGGHA